jgi:glycine dehydrogenase
MVRIRDEIKAVEDGKMPRDDNPLKHAPHTAEAIAAADWKHPYTREVAAFPAAWTRARKVWPAVGRINNAAGDRNLVCTCPSVESYGSG